MTIIRDWMGLDDPAKDRAEQQLREQWNRLRRIDAGIPVRARRVQVYPHPNRRASDRH